PRHGAENREPWRHDPSYCGVRAVRHPKADAGEGGLDRCGQARAAERRGGDVPEAPAQLFGVLRGEGDVGAYGVPRLPRPEQEVEEAEQRDREVEREPRGGADEPERRGADPRDELGAEVRESGAEV